jgi:hypothetical protein
MDPVYQAKTAIGEAKANKNAVSHVFATKA